MRIGAPVHTFLFEHEKGKALVFDVGAKKDGTAFFGQLFLRIFQNSW